MCWSAKFKDGKNIDGKLKVKLKNVRLKKVKPRRRVKTKVRKIGIGNRLYW